jgi:hypothetical protein
MNWKPGHAGTMKKIYNKSTGDLPFIGKSTYRDQFKQNEILPNLPLPKKTMYIYSLL